MFTQYHGGASPTTNSWHNMAKALWFEITGQGSTCSSCDIGLGGVWGVRSKGVRAQCAWAVANPTNVGARKLTTFTTVVKRPQNQGI